VAERVKRRSYAGEARREQAATRRRTVLETALERFTADGYAGTSMARIAAEAGVAVDTVYATIGRKPQLLLAVHDLVLGEGATDARGEPVAALQRRYVEAVRTAPTAAEKVARYAAALGRLLPRTAPLLDALREAGATDPACRQVWESVEQRRAANMRLFAADLRATGELRDDLTDEEVADLVWSMNSASYFLSLRSRGWTAERYAALVRDVWTRSLVR
jgi:AcrR family transcriptional regulator